MTKYHNNPASKNANIIIKDPFDQLDAYNEVAFAWATNISHKIDLDQFIEWDPLITSVAFAYVFSVFIHLTMGYFLVDFESYLDENTKKSKTSSWDRMHGAVREIYAAMLVVYKDPMEIYKTLYGSILIEREDGEYIYDDGKKHTLKVEPYDYKEDKGFRYVCEGFNY